MKIMATIMLILGVGLIATPEQTLIGYLMGIVCLIMFVVGLNNDVRERGSV